MPKGNNPFFGADPGRTSFKFAYRLNITDFKEFFDTQINYPVRINKSYSEFHNMDPEDQKKYKCVKYFTPAAFKTDQEDKAVKTIANCESISLVCIDVDDNEDAATIISNIGVVYEMLGNYNFAIYKTASYKQENPRIRVVVEADGFSPDIYKSAVSWVAGKLGITKITVESCIPSQAMYRPTTFIDTNIENDHPVLAHRHTGVALGEDAFIGTELLDTVSKSGGRKQSLSDNLSGLEFLMPRLDSVTLDDVKDALSQTDPDLDMMSWVKVGMGMRHQFVDCDEDAFDAFDEWSSKGSKYTSREDVEKRWQYFAANTSDRVPVTIRTTLLIAKSFGWDNEEIQQRYFKDIQKWLEESETFASLVGKGVDRIAGCPLLTPTLQDSLLSQICRIGSQKFEQKVLITTLRKSLKKKHSSVRQAEKDQKEKDKPIPSWARGLCFVGETKKLFRVGTGEAMDRDAFDSLYARYLLPTKEQLEEIGEADNIRAKNTPLVRPQDFVLNDLQVPTVFSDVYDPANPDESFVKKDGINYVNTYRMTHPEASTNEADIKKAGDIIRSHIAILAKEPELQDMLIQFIAVLVQRPGQKIRWAPLSQGQEGNGKGLLAKLIRSALGYGHVKVVDPEKIFSAYNDWAYGTQLAVLNEIHSKGHSRYEVENKLKEPIADDHVSINQKYRDHREVDNVTNYILFTNFPDALAISAGSRRYLVIKSWVQTKAQVLELNASGHFDRVADLIKNYPRAIRAFFERVEIPDDFPIDGPPPVTRYQLEMQQATMPEAELLTDQLLEDGDHPLIQSDLISSTSLLNALNAELGNRTNSKYLANVLRQMGYVQAGRYRLNGERHTLWLEYDSMLKGLDLQSIAEERFKENSSNLLD